MNIPKFFSSERVAKGWAFGLLFFLGPLFLFVLLLVNEFEFFGWPAPEQIIRLHIYRMSTFSIFYTWAVIAVSKQILAGVTWKQVAKWGFLILLSSLIPIVGTAWIENPIHTISCCGLGNVTYWGWVYDWIFCYEKLDFCGYSQGKLNGMAILGNIVFHSSIIIVFITLWKGKRIRLFQALRQAMEEG